MNKKNLINCTVYTFILLTTINIYAKKKVRKNNVYFDYPGNKVEFIINRHCVTKGKPYQTPDGSLLYVLGNGKAKHKEEKYLVIKSGRHHSTKTVKCLSKSMLSNANPYNYYFTFDNIPDSLNFAVQGTLIFDNEVFNDIIVAQGHCGASNNWWFGGNHCERFQTSDFKRFPQEAVTCTSSTGKKWCFLRGHYESGGWGLAHYGINNSPNEINVLQDACTEGLFVNVGISPAYKVKS